MPEVPAPRAVLSAWTPPISEQIAQRGRNAFPSSGFRPLAVVRLVMSGFG